MASSGANLAAPVCIREVSTRSFKFEICIKACPSPSRSPIFTFQGHDWRLIWNISDIRDVQLWLQLISTDHVVKATVDFTLLDKYGDLSSEYQRVSHYFSPTARVCNLALLTRYMYSGSYYSDDCFGVLCTIFIAGGGETTKAELNQNSSDLKSRDILSSDLVENLTNLLKSQDMSDVSFEVDGEIFHAHRVVLAARSQVFKAELFGRMVEANKECIKLEGMKAEVFKCLLHYIYTDTIEDTNTEFNHHLLEAADRYALDRLMKICEDRLCRDINLNTVLSSLGLADQHNCRRLLECCLQFAANPENLLQLTLRQEYLDLMRNCPSVFAMLSEKASASRAFQNIIYKKQTIG